MNNGTRNKLVASLVHINPDRFIIGHTFDFADDTEPIFVITGSDEGVFIDTRCRCSTTATVVPGDSADLADLVIVEHAAACSWLLGASRGAA